MSNDTMVVDCGRCRKHFDLLLSFVKGTDSFGDPILYEKHRCPHCNKNHKDYFNPTVNHSEAIDNYKAKLQEEQRQKANQPISCPHCNSTQLYASDKGFGVGKALVGGAALGGIGLLAGFLGSKKVMLTCLACGHKWKAGN